MQATTENEQNKSETPQRSAGSVAKAHYQTTRGLQTTSSPETHTHHWQPPTAPATQAAKTSHSSHDQPNSRPNPRGGEGRPNFPVSRTGATPVPTERTAPQRNYFSRNACSGNSPPDARCCVVLRLAWLCVSRSHDCVFACHAACVCVSVSRSVRLSLCAGFG